MSSVRAAVLASCSLRFDAQNRGLLWLLFYFVLSMRLYYMGEEKHCKECFLLQKVV